MSLKSLTSTSCQSRVGEYQIIKTQSWTRCT